MTTTKWHNQALALFGEAYYTGLVGHEHLSEEIVVEDQPFWLAIRNNTKYLLPRELVSKLPIKVVDTTELKHRGKMYYVVTKYQTVTFKQERNHTFHNLVDSFAPFSHTNPQHFLLYKLLCLASYLSRLNFRVATNCGYGKDSVWEALHLLRRDVAVINPRSMPALEYRLFSKALVLNELSNLEAGQRDLVQEFLLLCGDMRTTYEKSTRATGKTRDLYDIKDLSLVAMFNDYEYYEAIGKEDKFFDNVFTKAVLDRFMPFKFTGKLNGDQFILHGSARKILDENTGEYIKILRSLEYYKHNWTKELHGYKFSLDEYKLSPRHKQSLDKICKFIDLYANSQEEFDSLVSELMKCNREYKDMMAADKFMLEEAK